MTATIRNWHPGDEAICEAILRSVPEWFGIEEALLKYVAETAKYPTFLSLTNGVESGFITIHQHFPQAAEIHCIAVHAAYHRQGLGRALIQFAEQDLAAKRVMVLQVKTMGPSRPSPFYDQTRQFYEAIGFVPLEEFPTLWERIPCLQMVKQVPA